MPCYSHTANDGSTEQGGHAPCKRYIFQGNKFQQDGQNHCHDPVSSQSGITHDFQHPLSRTVTEKTICRIPYTIKIEATSYGDKYNQGKKGRDLNPEIRKAQIQNDCSRQTDQKADNGHPFHTLNKPVNSKIYLQRDRVTGHKLDHQQQARHRLRPLLPVLECQTRPKPLRLLQQPSFD